MDSHTDFTDSKRYTAPLTAAKQQRACRHAAMHACWQSTCVLQMHICTHHKVTIVAWSMGAAKLTRPVVKNKPLAAIRTYVKVS